MISTTCQHWDCILANRDAADPPRFPMDAQVRLDGAMQARCPKHTPRPDEVGATVEITDALLAQRPVCHACGAPAVWRWPMQSMDARSWCESCLVAELQS